MCFSYTHIFACLKSSQSNEENDNKDEKKESEKDSKDTIFKELDNKIEALIIERAEWDLRKAELLEQNPSLNSLPHMGDTVIVDKHHSIVLTFLKATRNAILPADYEIQEIINEANAEIEERIRQLEIVCQKANDFTLSDEEYNNARLEICNDSLSILDNEMVLLNGIKAELQYSIDFEKMTETIVGSLVRLAILVYTKVPIPSTGFSLNSEYKNYLFNKIQGEMNELTDIKAVIENEMKRAKASEEETMMIAMNRETHGNIGHVMRFLGFNKNDSAKKNDVVVENRLKI